MRRFITTASCLLTLIGVVTTHSAQAQSGPVTASTNQKNETSKPQRDEGETETVSDAQLIRIPFKQSRWFTRVGFMVAPYHSSTTIATNGQTLA
ncbi:MAG TPA: hypothetical protein VFP64_21465, partial [Pyrinomonadaceae bacterium]|nr:hypothetical protein [Pyrinomonadaceae bacterium]